MENSTFDQTKILDRIAAVNGICVPRCRAYRLMRNEKCITVSEIEDRIGRKALYLVEKLLEADALTNERAEARIRRYMTIKKEPDGLKRTIGIRWERIHGKLRKRIKRQVKIARRLVSMQAALWNQYVGNGDVLYIQARLSSADLYDRKVRAEVCQQPWFLALAEDYLETSYCDIYAKINGANIQ